MKFEILLQNLTNPTLLFFLLGVLAVIVKSDLEIPSSSIRFISLYLLFSIGFKGGQELAHSPLSHELLFSILFAICIASIIPVYSFYLLKKKVDSSNAAAIVSAYGSVSAVTFVMAIQYLEMENIAFGGHMVAVMAFMEFPAIIVGVLLLNLSAEKKSKSSLGPVIRHSFTNGSVLIIIGSLLIGMIADVKQAEGIKPFTTDIFKGFLAIFLLEMGIVTAKRFSAFKNAGLFLTLFAVFMPLFNGIAVCFLSQLVTSNIGNRFILAVLAASASYIAVPAAMKLAAPKADPGIYIPMALGVTFPFNITFGMPIYYLNIQQC